MKLRYYEADNTQDNGSCEYPEEAYDCDGNCLSDVDGDGTCDELEVLGCTILKTQDTTLMRPRTTAAAGGRMYGRDGVQL